MDSQSASTHGQSINKFQVGIAVFIMLPFIPRFLLKKPSPFHFHHHYPFVNTEKSIILDGDFEYMTDGYYACQLAELESLNPMPTCADALDAYIVPIALERVAQAGLPVPTWYLTNEYFTPPAVLYGVNPFARAHAVVLDNTTQQEAVRSISRKGKFVICCQEVTSDAVLIEFEQVFDQSTDPAFSSWARDLFELFNLPLSNVRLIQQGIDYAFSAIERLPYKSLSEAGKGLLKERGHVHG